MTQLDHLTNFIRQSLPPRALIGFDSWMDNFKLIRAPKALGNGGLRQSFNQYDIVLAWDDFPFRVCDPNLVFALVNAWLSDHGDAVRDELDLGEPDVDLELVDKETAILVISVPAADVVTLFEDDTGAVEMGGRRYRVDAPEIWTAEAFELS